VGFTQLRVAKKAENEIVAAIVFVHFFQRERNVTERCDRKETETS